MTATITVFSRLTAEEAARTWADLRVLRDRDMTATIQRAIDYLVTPIATAPSDSENIVVAHLPATSGTPLAPVPPGRGGVVELSEGIFPILGTLRLHRGVTIRGT